MDRIHRALGPHKADGPPPDIIAKFHFFRTKDQITAAARLKESLTFQGHTYQMFADLSPITVAKRREIKPLLLNLQLHHIPYQWGFPFSIRFTYQGAKYSSKTTTELKNTLQKLQLYNKSSANTRRRALSDSPPNSSIPEPDGNRQATPKRGRFNPPVSDQQDTMD